MKLLKCKHPAKYLTTIEKQESIHHPVKDHDILRTHLYCFNCDTVLELEVLRQGLEFLGPVVLSTNLMEKDR